MSFARSAALVAALLAAQACGPILSSDGSSTGSFAGNSDNLETDPATANVTSPAMYRDENFDGRISAGDTIELEFDRNVRVVGSSIQLDFPVNGDLLGGVTAIRATTDPRRVRLVLDDNWTFRCRQQYDGSTGVDSASALTVVRSDSIQGGAKRRAGRSLPADFQPAFVRDSGADFDLSSSVNGPCRALAAGDFNQDGSADLATAFDGVIHVWANTGSSFRVTHTFGFASPWNSIQMVDLDGDGRADLAGASDAEVGVWLYDPVKDRYGKLFRDYTANGRALAIGQLLGDAAPDLVVASGQQLLIYRNDGAAGFTRVSSPSLGFAATCLAVGDLDRDGDDDIVAANQTRVQWWRNDNSRNAGGKVGGLAPPVGQDTQGTFAILLADSDRDGLPDLHLGNDGPNEVWRNTSRPSAISFQRTAARLGNEPTRALAALDFDLDGHLDVVAGNAQGLPDAIYVHRNNLSFDDSGQRLGNDTTLFLAAADFDGDGDDDLAAANENWNKLWRSSLAGSTDSQAFQKERYIQRSFEARSSVGVALADLDGDGDADLVCANGLEPRGLFRNPGSGRFGSGSTPFEAAAGAPASPDTRAVALVDVNLDGRTDVVFANRAGVGAGLANEVWLSDGQGRFEFHQALGDAASADVLAMDLNRDGLPDLVFASELATEPCAVFLNQGDPSQWFPTTPSLTFEDGFETVALASGDLDRDGLPDLVTANQTAGGGAANHVYLADGNGGLVPTGVAFTVAGIETALHTTDVALADMNEDGRLDVLFAQRAIGGLSGATQWFVGAGDGTFAFAADDGDVDQEVAGIAAADVDFDGVPDLFYAQRGAAETALPHDDAIRLNPWRTDTQVFGELVELGERRNSRQVVVHDVDGDGDLDFVVAVEGGRNLVFLRR